MTVHQLKEPCWVIDPEPPGENYHRHYDTRSEARTDLRQAVLDGYTDLKSKAVQLDAACWLIKCDGDCGEHIDEADEGFISHCETRQVAEEIMAAYRWSYRGDLVFCEDDAPEGSEIPPPSAAELEAAGQLRLPGVA